MMENNDTNWYAMSDIALLEMVGSFIKETRLQQNKSQEKLSEAAGINRSTLVRIEKSGGGTLLTLIQVLRALDKLPALRSFQFQPKVSPIQLATMEQEKRQRARTKNTPDKKPDTDW